LTVDLVEPDTVSRRLEPLDLLELLRVAATRSGQLLTRAGCGLDQEALGLQAVGVHLPQLMGPCTLGAAPFPPFSGVTWFQYLKFTLWLLLCARELVNGRIGGPEDSGGGAEGSRSGWSKSSM
jgi:hypothetical protein